VNSTEKKYFWLSQITGWGLIGAVNIGTQLFTGGIPVRALFFNFFAIAIGGFIVSSVFRHFWLKQINWIGWKKPKLVISVFLYAILLSFVWMLLLNYACHLFLSKKLTLDEILSNLITLFTIMLIWNLLYFGYHLIRHYHLAEVEKWKLKAEVHKAQLDILKLQINPHFLFNTLNNIRALILEDQTRARQMLTNFSDLFRYSLQNSERKEVSLSEELEIVRNFLELAKIQYEERMKYVIFVDEGLEHESIPPMVIQILVENAIKHGIALSQKRENSIYISIQKKNNTLIIQVKNTGTLNTKNKLETSQGLGLKNIKERLSLLYGKDAIFEIIEEPPLVSATIQITK
jgi:two-component system, LytTR family, sensor kinase